MMIHLCKLHIFYQNADKRHTLLFLQQTVYLLLFLSPCLQIPITLHKEKDYNEEGREVLKCGFKIGGGIDQDYKKSPQGYTDYVSKMQLPFFQLFIRICHL